jgi:hypothetical protein
LTPTLPVLSGLGSLTTAIAQPQAGGGNAACVIPAAATMLNMSRYILPLPHVKFEREWVLGPVMFRPSGALLTEAENLPDFTAQVKNYRLALDQIQEMAKAWASHATVEVQSDDNADAETLIRQAVAILQLFMRPEVSVNVWLHKIGLVGDVSLAIREYISIDQSGRAGFGSRRVDGPISFTFTQAMLDKWDADPRLQFLSAQLARSSKERSRLGSRALTAIVMLDVGFLAIEPTVKILSYAVAVEAMMSREPEMATKDQPTESTLRIARRMAYLKCPRECGRSASSCPYIEGLGKKALVEILSQAAQKGQEWRCTWFLRYSCPDELAEAIGSNPSLFSARHQVAHEGVTTASDSDMKWFAYFADQAIFAALGWFAQHPTASITDLDDEIDAASATTGLPA